jgi:replication factor C small subunit
MGYEMWSEKYRPRTLKEMRNQNEIVSRLSKFVETKGMPHCLFAGPPGTGKCVAVGTEVLTPTGVPEKIEEMNGNEVITILPNGQVARGSYAYVFLGRAERIFAIKTRSGREVKCTPEHVFPVLNSCNILWKQASEIRKGDKILVVSKLCEIPLTDQNTAINFFEKMEKVEGKLLCNLGSPLSEKYGRRVKFAFIKHENLSDLKKALKTVVINYERRKNGSQFSQFMKPVWKITPELLEIVGYLQSGGSGWRRFASSDPRIVRRFKYLMRKVFGLKVRKLHGDDHYIPRAMHYEAFMNGLFGEYSKNRVPKVVLQAPTAMTAGYLRAFFDGKGWTGSSGIGLRQKHQRIVEEIAILLLRLGIFSRIRKAEDAATLYICDERSKKRFREIVGLTRSEKLAKVNFYTSGYEDSLDIDLSDVAHVSLPSRRGSVRSIQGGYSKWRIKNRSEAYVRIDELIRAIIKQKNALQSAEFEINKLLKLAKPEVTVSIEKKLREAEGGGRKPHFRVSKAIELDDRHHVLNSKERRILNLYLHVKKHAIQAMNHLAIKETKIGSLIKSRPTRLPYLISYAERLLEAIRRRLIELKEAEEKLACATAIVLSNFVYDEIVDVNDLVGEFLVADLANATNHAFVLANGIVAHNTTAALCLAHDLFGERYMDCFMELNASDARGIDVIRTTVKEFARIATISDVPFKILVLDEADNMTADAQHALRRTMEKYTETCRFILSCNYSGKIIEPIQSRCAIFRFTPLSEEDVADHLRCIAEKEGVKFVEAGIKAVVEMSEGDLRKAINMLQAAASLGKTVDEDSVYLVVGRAKPRDVKDMLDLAFKGDFVKAREKLRAMLVEYGLSGSDILKQIHSEIFKMNIPERKKVALADVIGEIDYRLIQGADEEVQLSALLARLAFAAE